MSADKEAQPRQIFRGDALGNEVHMHDAVWVILEHRRDGGNGVREIIGVGATSEVQVGKLRRVDVYFVFQFW